MTIDVKRQAPAPADPASGPVASAQGRAPEAPQPPRIANANPNIGNNAAKPIEKQPAQVAAIPAPAPAPAAKPPAPAAAKPAPAAKPPAPVAKPPAPVAAKPAPAPAKPAPVPVAKAPAPVAAKPALAPAKLTPPPAKPAPAVPMAHDLLHLDATHLLKKHRNAFLLRVFLFVIMPTLASAFYTFIYVTPRYVSEFQVMYVPTASSGGATQASSLIGGLLGGGSYTDFNRVIGTYIISPAAMEIVDKKDNLRKQYSDSRVDWLNRMPANAPAETFLKYFQNRVTYWEQTGGFVTVDVQGFTPKDAQSTAKALLKAADDMIATINMRPLLDQVEFTKKERGNYRRALQAATDQLTRFREENNNYNFSAAVAGLDTIVTTLNAQLAQARSQLAYDRRFLGPKSPTVQILEGQIAGIEGQIQAQHNRLASPAGKDAPVAAPGVALPTAPPARDVSPYSQVMAKYLDLVQSQDFALKAYTTAESAYEAAKLAAAAQPAYAITFVPPNLPEHATSPAPLTVIPTVFLIALVVYSLGSLLIAMARDQVGS